MSIEDVKRAIEILNDHGGGDFEGKKSPELISAAEKKLNVQFPPSYRFFLEELGCGDIEGLEFYGVINEDFENSSVPDAIWLTLSQRNAGLPLEYVVVYSGGEGTLFVLDTTQSEAGEHPVYACRSNAIQEKVASSFGTFLLNELGSVL